MDWGMFFDADKNVLYGGYNTGTARLNLEWHLPFLGADSRLASFLAIASGKVPVSSWAALDRFTEERYHIRYLDPGWQGGGLFMQYLSGLWLDERGTVMGQSAQNFAYAQIMHKGRFPYITRRPHEGPWGWSASDSPAGEYLGWGRLRDEIVTPHACVLAIADFPGEVVENLRTLERLGARNKRLGFYDAIDVKTGKVAENFLLLDQSMLFLSLANYLRNDCVRKYFQADPLVQQGRQQVADYYQPAFGTNTALCMLSEPPKDIRLARQKSAIARRFDNWRHADWQQLDAIDSLEVGTVTAENEARARFAFEWDDHSLYFAIEVQDNAVVNNSEASKLYEEDSAELFVDPQNDGLRWGNKADFQFGFAVMDKTWEWFGQRNGYKATTQKSTGGYVARAAIPWNSLGAKPQRGLIIQVSPAVKSIGREGGSAIKLNWSWKSEADAVELGRLTLE
jgi:hypothetical protein